MPYLQALLSLHHYRLENPSTTVAFSTALQVVAAFFPPVPNFNDIVQLFINGALMRKRQITPLSSSKHKLEPSIWYMDFTLYAM